MDFDGAFIHSFILHVSPLYTFHLTHESFILHQTLGHPSAKLFLDSIASSYTSSPSSDKVEYETSCQIAQNILDPHSLVVFKWALASHVTSPRVAAQMQAGRHVASLFPSHDFSSIDAFAVRVHRDTAHLLLDINQVDAADSIENLNIAKSLSTVSSTDYVGDLKCTHDTSIFVYADISSTVFSDWHAFGSTAKDFCYILRHWRSPQRITQPVALQGYAVTAAVKATEYTVVDDRVFKYSLFPNEPHGAAISHSYELSKPIDGSVDMDVFSEPFVGVTAALHIAAAASFSDLILRLSHIADDAPVALRDIIKKYEPTATQRRTSEKVSNAVRSLASGGDALVVNGRVLEVSNAVEQSLPSSLRCLASISSATNALMKAGLSSSDAARILHVGGKTKDGGSELRVKLDGADDVTVWFNDLTKDRRYKEWDAFHNDSKAPERFVQAVQKKGEPRNQNDFDVLVKVRANLLEFVLALDPGDPRTLGYLNIPEQIVKVGLPIQVGVILVPNDEVSTMMTAGFHFFRVSKGKKAAVSFLSAVTNILEYMGGGFRQVALSPQIVDIAFNQVSNDIGSTAYRSVLSVMKEHEEVKGLLTKAREWAHLMGLFVKNEDDDENKTAGSTAATTEAFSMISTINGILLKDLVKDILPTALHEQRRLAQHISSSTSPVPENQDENGDWVLRDDSLVVVRRVSKSLLSQKPRDILAGGSDSGTKRMSFLLLQQTKDELDRLTYQQSSDGGKDARGAVTAWFVPCDEEYTSKIIAQLVPRPFMKEKNVRVAALTMDHGVSENLGLCDVEGAKATLIVNGRALLLVQGNGVEDIEAEVAAEYISKPSKLAAAMKLSDPVDTWNMALLAATAVHNIDESCGGGEKADEFTKLQKIIEDDDDASDFVYPRTSEEGRKDDRTLSIFAVCDPLGNQASATAAFLSAIHEAFGDDVHLSLIISPNAGSREEVPKERRVFSRFVLSPVPKFGSDGNLLAPRARFDRLPQKSILTFDVKQPRAWFIASYATNYDMDNVILESLAEDVPTLHAEYRLQSLLVEGSCVDENGSPPQGLQLELETGEETIDTTVMANLGYFQLRVPAPGRWSLQLAAGRSKNIFNIRSVDDRLSSMFGAAGASKHTFVASDANKDAFDVTVDSLDGACGTLLRVSRKPGMEGQKLLVNSDNEDGGRAKEAIRKVGSFVSGFLGRKEDGGEKEKSNTINVFSVASGHLYERFLKIMMLSVTKHTERPVKFWLLENYLSPAFKKSIPTFASERGFEVEWVTYRWPGWLREQSEKQRIIWAYKILFLDVIFPLNVDRIIFVDADQVVRGDLGELMDMKFTNNEPYGYVPFCESRKEVEGYRFWKTGFWAKTLNGQKYRISALYVVDLVTLRNIAAGDRLRAMYQSLSADPNSLSNLDQDLPNYAAAVGNVPIFDLPQKWLWCESWCDDESKEFAKTIDLCNNPMTKEPKLVSAKRIIKEWTSLDDEANEATEKIYKGIVGGETKKDESEEDISQSEEGKEEL